MIYLRRMKEMSQITGAESGSDNLEKLVNITVSDVEAMPDNELENVYRSLAGELSKINKNMAYPATIGELYANFVAGRGHDQRGNREKLIRKYAIFYISEGIKTVKNAYAKHEKREEEQSFRAEAALREADVMTQAQILRKDFVFSWKKQRKHLEYPYTAKDRDTVQKLSFRFKERALYLDPEDRAELLEATEREGLLAFALKQTRMLGEEGDIYAPSSFDDWVNGVDIVCDLGGKNIALLFADTTHNQHTSKLEEKLLRGMEQPLRILSYPTDEALKDKLGIPIVLGITRDNFEAWTEKIFRTLAEGNDYLGPLADKTLLEFVTIQIKENRKVMRAMPDSFFDNLNTSRSDADILYENTLERLHKIKESLPGRVDESDSWLRRLRSLIKL